MGFSEGTEDEFLLTCFVCKEPFGMLAAFCGGCGSRRDQAMGVERAKSSQQITANVIQTPSFEEQLLLPKTEKREKTVETPFTQPKVDNSPFTEFAVKPKTERKPRKKSIRRQIFISNIRLRIEGMNNWQSRHARILNPVGTLLFIGVSALFIQSFLVGVSHPEVDAEKYLKAAVTRDETYFDINDLVPGAENHPIFPAKYLTPNTASDWIYKTSISGLSGKAKIAITPAGSDLYQVPVELNMEAKYEKTLGVFRKATWVPSEQTATFTIDYPFIKDTLIYINGFAAGTVGNPVVKEGTYYIYPGLLEFKFYRNGSETNESFEVFIQTNGEYESS